MLISLSGRGLFSFALPVVPRALYDCPRARALSESEEASVEERGYHGESEQYCTLVATLVDEEHINEFEAILDDSSQEIF